MPFFCSLSFIIFASINPVYLMAKMACWRITPLPQKNVRMMSIFRNLKA
jgi:hypothetical protein